MKERLNKRDWGADRELFQNDRSKAGPRVDGPSRQGPLTSTDPRRMLSFDEPGI